jgi:four helix bundle protein
MEVVLKMPTIRIFEDLEVWKVSRDLYQQLRPLIEILRNKKEFRFAEQMKSASGSIMDNIAEGFERKSRLEFIYSLGIACGEAAEIRSQLYRCLDDGYVTIENFNVLYALSEKVGNQLAGFINYLNKSDHKGLKFKDRNPKPKS